jgi:hypothetical protein
VLVNAHPDYRERLNDKIAELGLYLFEAQNKPLEEEVIKLKQIIAILGHIVASNKAWGFGITWGLL